MNYGFTTYVKYECNIPIRMSNFLQIGLERPIEILRSQDTFVCQLQKAAGQLKAQCVIFEFLFGSEHGMSLKG